MSIIDGDLFPATFTDFAPDHNQSTQNGLNCQLVTFDSRLDSQGDRLRIEVGQDKEFYDLDRLYVESDPALVVIRHFDRQNVLEWKELIVKSIHMQKILRDCISEYPDVQLHTNPISIMNSPRCLFFYFEELQKHGRSLNDPVAVRHLVFLLRYIDHCFRSARISYNLFVKKPKSTASLDWENLWTVFRPGTLVFWESPYAIPIVSKVEKITICECCKFQCPKHDTWLVNVLNVDFTGKRYEWVRHTVPLKTYDGFRRLDQLRVFPLEYHPDQADVFANLAKRGEKFLALSKIHYMHYSGSAWIDRLRQRVPCKGRFIIDNTTFAQAKPRLTRHYDDTANASVDTDDDFVDNSRVNTTMHFRVNTTMRITHDETKSPVLSQTELTCCTPLIPGFSLTYKTWTLLHVDEISEIEFNETAFDHLLLPVEQKAVLKALVASYEGASKYSFDDIIRGKGKGLIFLLHGVPGVGKTLTAESIADLSKRPLYTITSGELGVTLYEVNHRLMTALRLAESWNAIVLIDEADVFLARRELGDVKRNALVSIFLTMMEYYEGIMFLTTNRINTIDSAFLSRIHLAIQYQEHTGQTRQALWQNFIARASPDKRPSWLNDATVLKLASYQLNGRQIRNCMRIACALANGAGKALRFEDLEAAAQYTVKFNGTLQSSLEDDTRSEYENQKTVGKSRKRRRNIYESDNEDDLL